MIDFYVNDILLNCYGYVINRILVIFEVDVLRWIEFIFCEIFNGEVLM